MNEKKIIRILHVFGYLGCGGAEAFIMNIYRNIDKNKFQFDFIVHSKGKGFYDEEVKALGAKIYYCPQYKAINHHSYKKWWKSFFKSHKEYSIIHSHVRSTASIYLKIAKKFKLYTIMHSHSTSNGTGLKGFVKNFLQKKVVKYSDHLLACSSESGRWLYGNNKKQYKFNIIYNSIDLEKNKFSIEKRDSFRKKYNIEDKKVLCHVGRFAEAKNHSFLIDVFRELTIINNDYYLILCGDGELKNDILSQIHEYQINEKVLLMGNVNNIDEVLSGSDFFIFPSKWEGLPLSVVEAQASGIQVLMSDSITNEVVLDSNVNTLPLNNAREWAMFIENMEINSENRIIKMENFTKYDSIKNALYIESFYKSIYKG